MIVAHVVRQYYPSIGGFEEVVKNLAKHQIASGHDAYVITLDRYFKALDTPLAEKETIDGVSVIRIPFTGSTRYPLAPSVLKYIKNADIVHVHAIDFFYDFLAITKLIHKKKLVATTHGGFFHTQYASNFKKIFFNTITRFSSLFYSKVIASSENDGEIFKQIIPMRKLQVIENGVDIEKLYVESKTKFPPTLLYFGRWSENKGILETLNLFNKLKRSDPNTNWKMIIAGRPYDLSKHDITKMVDKLDLANVVEVIDNPKTETLKSLTMMASYFISMSKFEGFGIAPIEAMSAGLTPILSAIEPFKKLVKNTNQGLIINQSHSNAVENIIQHYQDKNFNLEMLQNSIQSYTWSDVNLAYSKAYEVNS